MNVLHLSPIFILSLYIVSFSAFRTPPPQFNFALFNLELNKFKPNYFQTGVYGLYPGFNGGSRSHQYNFTSTNVYIFDAGFFTVQTQIDFDPATKLSIFTNTEISTTYNSKVYSVNLDKSSYLNQNGFDF